MSDDGDLDVAWMSDRMQSLILAAVDGDAEKAVDILVEVGERYGDRGGYTLCHTLADTAVRLGDFEPGDDGFWGFDMVDMRGVAVAPEDADGAEDMVLAMRFLMAHLNNDDGQKMALFHAHLGTEEVVLLPFGLVKLVGALGRRKLDQAGAGGDR